MKELKELRQLAQQTDNQKAVSLYNKVDKEIERLNNIINNAIKYVEKMSYQDIVDNPKKDLIKILKKEK